MGSKDQDALLRQVEADLAEVIRMRAEIEVADEMHREAIEREKARIRARLATPWWRRWLPTVTITWRTK